MSVAVVLKWGRQKFNLVLDLKSTYGQFQDHVYELTNVPVGGQKLLLRYKGKTPDRDVLLSDLKLKENQKINLIGVAESKIEEVKKKTTATGLEHLMLIDDMDSEEVLSGQQKYLIADSTEAGTALMNLITTTKEQNRFHFIHQPRPGRKCLVLDLDQTLLHFSSKSNKTSKLQRMIRPYMHDFLKRAYVNYDIGIWSQTKWSWVEIKLYELGMLNHPDYRLCFAIDDSHTVRIKLNYKPRNIKKYRKFQKENPEKSKFVINSDDSLTKVFSVKPLQLVWAFHEEWSAANTIHIDDLAKNFVYNPQCGFVCSPYKRKNQKHDKELIEIAGYLEYIATSSNSFESFNHSEWREVMLQNALKKINS